MRETLVRAWMRERASDERLAVAKSARRASTLFTSAASAWLLLTPSAHAQDAPPSEPTTTGDDARAEHVGEHAGEPSVEARLRALEAENAEQRRALEEARARIEAVEARPAAEEPALAVAPTAPPSPAIRPLASLVTRFEHREGYDALASPRAAATAGCYGGNGPTPTLSDSDCVRYRARVGFEITPIDLGRDVVATIRFMPQVSGFWAMSGLSLGGPGGIGASTSGGTVDALLGLHEGSLALQLGTTSRLEVGRFEMGYGDNVVIGTLDWHPNGRAFDGARMRITPERNSYWIDAFFTLVNEGHALSLLGGPPQGGFAEGDQSFYGLYAGLGPLLDDRPTTALDVYALFLQTNNRQDAAAMAEREWSLRATLGARFRYRVGLVDVRAEGAFQTGREGALRAPAGSFGPARTVVAGFALGEVGLNLLDNQLRVALEGNFASGNQTRTCASPPCADDIEEGYAQLFPTAHAFFGYTDLMGGRSNIAGGVLHASYRPIDEFTLALDWHVFVIPERPATASSNYAGQEGNLNVIWTPLPGLRARAMYGIFLPETAFFRAAGAPNYDTDPAHYVEVELAYLLR